jgi:putative hydrolase of the HAD superfamily
MLRAVFFDAAGTILHLREPAGLSYTKIARRFGLEADERAVMAAFRRAFRAAPGLAFGPGHGAGELRRMEREWWREVVLATFAGMGRFTDFEACFDQLFALFANPSSWSVAPEAPRLFQSFKTRGLILGVISNFDHRLYHVIDALELARHFDSITISSEVGWAKPAPEIFHAALARHALSPDEAIHVGDSQTHDLRGACAAGLGAVLVDPQCAEALVVNGRCARVRSLAGAAAALDRIGTG